MGKYSYTVYTCSCDKCGVNLNYYGEELCSESELKEAMNDLEWVEFKSGKIWCNECYRKEFGE